MGPVGRLRYTGLFGGAWCPGGSLIPGPLVGRGGRTPMTTTILYVSSEDGGSHRGPAAPFDQGGGDQRLAWEPGLVEQLGIDEPLQRHDLAVDTAHPHFFSAAVTPDVTIGAAHSQINLADRHRPARRSQ